MPALLRTIDGFLSIGRLNRDYYLHYGVEAGRIFSMPYAVDGEFSGLPRSARGRIAERLRAEHWIEAGRRAVILFASKMQPHQNAHPATCGEGIRAPLARRSCRARGLPDLRR